MADRTPEKDRTPLVQETPPHARVRQPTRDADLPPKLRGLPLARRLEERAKLEADKPAPKRETPAPDAMARLRR